MRKGNLTREAVVAKFGEALIAKLDSENCEHTNRIQTDGDEAVEFSASVTSEDGDVVTAYFYQSQDALDANADDLGGCDWEINGYAVD